ncbi:MAG: hypothetical protein NC133_01090 [Prevotella sp.]|nr:hypothetical protein [Prevotella sp.]
MENQTDYAHEEKNTHDAPLEQAAIQPNVDINALRKSYSELQSAFTKKAQAYKELEQKINSMPSREEIIREYLLTNNSAEAPAVLTSSSSAFDFAKEKHPTSLAQADRLACEYFKKGVSK